MHEKDLEMERLGMHEKDLDVQENMERQVKRQLSIFQS